MIQIAMTRIRRAVAASTVVAALALAPSSAPRADETCLSPYMPLITGSEEFVYVWTLGEEGWGDGSDKLVTIDVRDGSPTFGKVISTASVGSRNEAHHGDFTDDRRLFWASGLDSSRIFIFDVASDPARPRLVRAIDDFVRASGGVKGPHTFYALPGRMLVAALSNEQDRGGRTALVEYSNEGTYIATHWMPTASAASGAAERVIADGYGYDVRALPRKNVLLTSSFTGWSNYMRPLGELIQDQEAMKRFGNTMVLWNLHTRQPRKVFQVPGAPLEIRFAWGPRNNYAFTTSALTSKVWLVHEDQAGEWQAREVGTIGNPAQVPLPVDISLSSDDRLLWVSTFGDGKARAFDVSDPFNARQVYEKQIGRQVNMVSQSWDGRRLYFTSSLLSRWDKSGADNEQYVRAYTWDGSELQERFAIDFAAERIGRPHLMRFGSAALYRN
jgi:selenium-binding protein 1